MANVLRFCLQDMCLWWQAEQTGSLLQVGVEHLLMINAMEHILLCVARLHATDFAEQLVAMMLTTASLQSASGISRSVCCSRLLFMTETPYADRHFLLQWFCCPYGKLVQSELQVNYTH